MTTHDSTERDILHPLPPCLPEQDLQRIQAEVWEQDAGLLLDALGIRPDWRCIDLGCGATGILGLLSRRVGRSGLVAGLDSNADLIEAAEYAHRSAPNPVSLLRADALNTMIPAESFDLTHARFLFAHIGAHEQLLGEMLRLTRPGGVVAVQEPDAASWQCYPFNTAWDRLKKVVLAAFMLFDGDMNAGRSMYSLFTEAGVERPTIRAAVHAVRAPHPYLLLPAMLAETLRPLIVRYDLMSEYELDRALAECTRYVSENAAYGTTFTMLQVWGYKPGTGH